jgi:PEP-CTERM motif
MMRKQNLAAVVLATTVSAIAATPAVAAIDPTFNTGDLILGIQSSAATSTVLEINVGAPLLFKTADTSNTNIFIGNISSQLTGLFGSEWYNDVNLFFGVSGANNSLGGGLGGGPGSADGNGDFNSTSYLTRARLTNGTVGAAESTAWSVAAASVSTGAQQMVAQGNTFTATNVNGIAQVATSNPNDWSDLNPVSGTTQGTAYTVYTGGIQQKFETGAFDGGSFAGLSGVEGVVDLYRIARFSNGGGTPGVGAYMGSFAITQGGDLHFITTAIPEPGSALLVGLATLAGLCVRRRQPMIA